MADNKIAISRVWQQFGRALGAEPSDKVTLKGRSGIDHAIQALSVDEKGKRLIVISSEPNSRMAALVQSDIQSAFGEYQVLLARPLVYDLAFIARVIVSESGNSSLSFSSIKDWVDKYKGKGREELEKILSEQILDLFRRLGGASQRVNFPAYDHFVEICRQALALDWAAIGAKAREQNQLNIPLDGLISVDNLASDRANGVCPLPLYEFSDRDWGLFDDGNTDQLVDVLQGLDIYQYFFPPPDALALAVVEQGISKPSIVSDSVELAPKLGHFYGALEHANTFQGSIPELLDELGALGYVAEGDHGIEITPEGRTVRTSIKFRPREGLVAKILGRMHFNLTVSPHDIIPK